MARKRRRIDQVQAQPESPKQKARYEDAFQHNIGRKVEEVGKKFEGQGRTMLYAVAAAVVLLIAIGIFYAWNSRSNAAAQTALGKAIETSQAIVSASPQPAGSTARTFKTERERAEAAIAEFQAVAEKFGGDVGLKARYFVAVNKLGIDREAATAELEGLAGSGGEVGALSKFALAQVRHDAGKMDEAAAIYQELAGSSDPIVAKDTINFELAKIYEKQGKPQEAADLYFNIAKTASEAKDLEGKPVPMSATARNAKEKLEQLDPERAKEIQEPAPESPFGGAPIGM